MAPKGRRELAEPKAHWARNRGKAGANPIDFPLARDPGSSRPSKADVRLVLGLELDCRLPMVPLTSFDFAWRSDP